jgi:hypothetical protein
MAATLIEWAAVLFCEKKVSLYTCAQLFSPKWYYNDLECTPEEARMALAAALRLKEPLTLEQILNDELRAYQEDGYSPRFSPIFWRAVFESWYQDTPQNDSDPRWDALFAKGYPVLQKILGYETCEEVTRRK